MDLRLAVVGLVVVLAGCGALGGSGGPDGPFDTETDEERTLTPVAVPEVTAEPAPLPPGVTTAGVTDADALLDAHRAVLRNQSYTLTVRLSVDGVVSERLARVESPTRYYQREVLAGSESNVSRFASDRTVYTRSVAPNATRYARFDTVRPPGSQTVRESRLLLSVPTATVFETTVDGRPAFVVRGSYPVHPAASALRNVTLRAVVRPDGLVRSLNASYTRVDGADRTAVSRSFRYTDLGETTVDRPDWVAERWNVTGSAG